MKQVKTFGGVKLSPCPVCKQQPEAGEDYTDEHIPWTEERVNQEGGPYASEGDFMFVVRCIARGYPGDAHDEWYDYIHEAVGWERAYAAKQWNDAVEQFE